MCSIVSVSTMMMQNIKDRMMQNNKSSFIGKSYFVGATPNNDYTPSIPYEIEVSENGTSNRIIVAPGANMELRAEDVSFLKKGKTFERPFAQKTKVGVVENDLCTHFVEDLVVRFRGEALEKCVGVALRANAVDNVAALFVF